MIASDVTDLPEPGLPDDGQHLAGRQPEVDAPHGMTAPSWVGKSTVKSVSSSSGASPEA